jgi:hypothetical protein
VGADEIHFLRAEAGLFADMQDGMREEFAEVRVKKSDFARVAGE